MTTSTGKTGKGVMFQIRKAGVSPVAWWTIANVRSINFTGRSADEIDFTHLLSTGGYRELRQGFKDGGSIGIDYQFDATEDSHVGTGGLLEWFTSGNTFTWRINFGTAWSFALTGSGFVSNPGDIDINVDGPITGAATVRVTGDTSLVANT